MRTDDVPEAVLAELGYLDPGHDGERANARRQRPPDLRGLAIATQPPEQPGSLDQDPLLGPGRVLPRSLNGRPNLHPAAVVDGPFGGPPLVLVGIGSSGGRRHRDGGVQAVERFLQPALAREGAGQAGEIAAVRESSPALSRELGLDVNEQAGERADVLAGCGGRRRGAVPPRRPRKSR